MNRTIYKASEDFVKNIGDTELQHWKYIKKIPSGKGFRYFYSWDEWRAYLKDPAAEAKKAGQNAKQQIDNGRKAIENKLQSNNKGATTVNAIRQGNAQRDNGFRSRMNDFAKRVSEKWNADKNAVKKSIENGKNWFNKHLNPVAAYKRHKEEQVKRQKKEEADKRTYEEKREELAKKYKYIKKIDIGGKTRYFYSQDEIDAYERKQKYIANEPKFMKDVKHSEEPFTREEDAILVNPKYDSTDLNYSYNCAECTAIYELRRRGYDVESNGESGLEKGNVYNTEKRFDLFYENADTHYVPPASSNDEYYKNLVKEFDQYPPGSRGDISFKWNDVNAAHSIVWEKDSDGNVHFVDTQPSGHGNQVEYDMKELASAMDRDAVLKRKVKGKFFKQKTGYTNITRTDNLELKPEIKNICQDSSDNRPRVNTNNAHKYEAGNYLFGGGGVRRESRTMTEKEVVTKYPNLIDNKSYEKIKPGVKNNNDRDEITIIDEDIR